MDQSFIAACLQMRSTRSVSANLDAVVKLLREAASAGAHYVQTPEMTNIVERDRSRLMQAISSPDRDPILAALREEAKTHRLHVHIGSLAVVSGEKVANRAFVIGPDGRVAASYDKIHLFDVSLPNGESWRESATYVGGAEAVLTPLPGASLGLSICYDLRFPYLYRALAEAGAGVLSAPACFTRQTGEAHWVVLQRARAIENGAFMVSAAQGGLHEDGRDTFGHSIIVDPWGRVLAEAGDAPGVTLARIELAEIGKARGSIPTLQHTRRFSVSSAGASDEPAAA